MTALHYTAVPLDRAEACRRDVDWQRARLADPTTRIFPVWRERSLVSSGDAPRAVAVPPDGDLLAQAGEVIFLGVDGDGRACFAADLSALEEPALARLLVEARFTTLRRVGSVMDHGDGGVLALARALVHWHSQHRFCGVCGAATVTTDGGHMRACTGPGCGAHHFPRTDPAVIMLITRAADGGGECLLARQARWPKGMMSTLAGFVEPGETLEEAVAREIEEETGIRIASITYRGSQPWPFPSSLMLGFRAEAAAGSELRVNAAELEDARWFRRDEIRNRRSIGLILPGRDSIARRLIRDWVDEDEGETTAQTQEVTSCPAW